MLLIVCNLNVEGFHYWDTAPKDYDYLKFRHRHIFEIEAQIKVQHENRQIEINDQRKKIIEYLNNKYGDPCEFGNMSCEAIAQDIANKFNCYQVKVLEDGYCGAIYINNKGETT